jgi:hypothetical protein
MKQAGHVVVPGNQGYLVNAIMGVEFLDCQWSPGWELY